MIAHVSEGLTDPEAGRALTNHGHTPAAATRAKTMFNRLNGTLAVLGCVATDVCKITMRITDRARREPVYAAPGRRLAGVFPVSTALIARTIACPTLPRGCKTGHAFGEDVTPASGVVVDHAARSEPDGNGLRQARIGAFG